MSYDILTTSQLLNAAGGEIEDQDADGYTKSDITPAKIRQRFRSDRSDEIRSAFHISYHTGFRHLAELPKHIGGRAEDEESFRECCDQTNRQCVAGGSETSKKNPTNDVRHRDERNGEEEALEIKSNAWLIMLIIRIEGTPPQSPAKVQYDQIGQTDQKASDFTDGNQAEYSHTANLLI